MLCAGRGTAATNGDGQSKQEAEGVQEMRLWMCRTQKSMALAGRTRGGRCSKQIKQGSGLERRRAINRKRALGCGATARAVACWAAQRRKWRRVGV